MAQFEESVNPETGQVKILYNGEWLDKPEGFDNEDLVAPNPAEGMSNLDAFSVGAGKTFTNMGRGVENFYAEATGNAGMQERLFNEYNTDERLLAPLQEQNPMSFGLGEAAPTLVASFLPGGLLAQSALQGGLGGLTYNTQNAFDNGAEDAALTAAGYVGGNAATRIFKLIGAPMMRTLSSKFDKLTDSAEALYASAVHGTRFSRSARSLKPGNTNMKSVSQGGLNRHNKRIENAQNRTTAVNAYDRRKGALSRLGRKNADKITAAAEKGSMPLGLEALRQAKNPLGALLSEKSLMGATLGAAAREASTPFAGYEETIIQPDGLDENGFPRR